MAAEQAAARVGGGGGAALEKGRMLQRTRRTRSASANVCTTVKGHSGDEGNDAADERVRWGKDVSNPM